MEETTHQGRRRRLTVILTVSLLAVLIIGGAIYAFLRPRAPHVAVTTVHRQTIQNKVFASGDVHPVERQVVQPTELPSPVNKVLVKVGQDVHIGDVLITCDNQAQQAQLSAAKNQVAQAQASLNQTQAQANATPASLRAQFSGTLASLKASLSQAQAGLASAEAAYNQTIIKSRLNGTVLLLNPDGIAPDGSAAPIIEVVGQAKQVVLTVSEVDAVHLQADQKATVKSYAYPNKTWNATVKSVALFASSSGSGAGQVEVDLSLPSSCPIPFGYQVNVHITSETHKNVITVPYAALSQAGSEYDVYILQNGRVTQKPVQLGITTDTEVEVTSGLKVGQEVVLNPPTGLASGQRVVVVAHD